MLKVKGERWAAGAAHHRAGSLVANRPAIPGETDASGARFRFAGWENYPHDPLVLQHRVHGTKRPRRHEAAKTGAENKKALLNPVN